MSYNRVAIEQSVPVAHAARLAGSIRCCGSKTPCQAPASSSPQVNAWVAPSDAKLPRHLRVQGVTEQDGWCPPDSVAPGLSEVTPPELSALLSKSNSDHPPDSTKLAGRFHASMCFLVALCSWRLHPQLAGRLTLQRRSRAQHLLGPRVKELGEWA